MSEDWKGRRRQKEIQIFVESRKGAVALRHGQWLRSLPRSSNRTCGFVGWLSHCWLSPPQIPPCGVTAVGFPLAPRIPLPPWVADGGPYAVQAL